MLQKMKIMGLKNVKFQMMNTCLALQSHNRTSINPEFEKKKGVKGVRKKTAPEKNYEIQKKTLAGLETFSGVLVINRNQWLLM